VSGDSSRPPVSTENRGLAQTLGWPTTRPVVCTVFSKEAPVTSKPASRTSTPTDARSSDLAAPVAKKAGWTDLDVRAVDTARLLAADAVQKAGNGHPGTAMSLAPAAYLLYQNVMNHDPSDPAWLGRDRFVLSCGHSSLTQYVQLFLSGYGLELKDLKALRTWGSLTPGHPEVHHTKGVEITTGPLGSGLASAVGMAMAQRRQRGLFDPEAKAGESVFDHHVWVLASDGDLMEGVAAEASSLAGHQQLGNLTVVYDANQISIEDDTDISFSEDVAMRYESYGWEVIDVDWRRSADPGGTADYTEDIDALLAALTKSRRSRTKPTLVRLHTVIAWPAPTVRGTGKSHGSALGDAEIAATKELLGFDPAKSFEVDRAVLAHAREVKKRGKAAHKEWNTRFTAWRKAQPERAALLARLVDGGLPSGFEKSLPVFDADPKGLATRAASGKVLGALAATLPELWGGSADLAESNNTTMAGEPSFIPASRQTPAWKGGPYGRTLHFGIRENAMGMILNGIALEGLTRPYGGTFLVFSDYMRPAVRLAAIQQLPVTFVWTHDSIGLGEDGPTHQPIEHLASLRAMPGLAVVRPADANETAQAWAEILRRGTPAGLALSRQNLPVIDRTEHAKATGVTKGAYVLIDAASGSPDVILVATGSEVSLAVAARLELEKAGVATRVVSMPCREWFEEQGAAYRNKVLPPSVRARVSIEAGVAQGWRDVVGDSGRCVSIEHFGASADAATLFREFGFTPDAVVKAAKDSLAAARKAGQVPGLTETAPRARKDTGTDVGTPKAASRKSAAGK
jgi:transketolase